MPNALLLGYPVIDLGLSPNVPALDPQGQLINLNDLVLATVLGDAHPSAELKNQYRADLHVSRATPPAFIWHTADDELVPARNAILFASALAEHGVPYELHIFESGVHGLSLADETTDDQGRFINADVQIWIDLALSWLKRQTGRRLL